MVTDLFGHPLPVVILDHKPSKPRIASPDAKRRKLLRQLSESKNGLLFEDILDLLKAPLISQLPVAHPYASDIGGIPVAQDEDEEMVDQVSIPYEAWGTPFVTDSKGHQWSMESLLFTQVRIFWRSMEELVLHNNETEKWSVLKWIFRPARYKRYIYDKRMGRSHCLEVHEREEPFTFHNCCIAARVDEEGVREGVRRSLPDEVVQAIDRFYEFD